VKISKSSLTLALLFCLAWAALGCAQGGKQTKNNRHSSAAPSRSVKTIPVEIPISNQIYIQARLNNSEPMWFVLDTGATWTIIDVDKAKELNIKSAGNLTLDMGQRNTVTTTFADNAVLDIAGLKISVPRLAVMPVKFRHAPQIVGLIGSELFKRYVVEFNYQAKTINLFEPASYHYTGSGQILPIELSGEIPHIMVNISRGNVDSVASRLLLDTGASQTVLLNGPFVEKNKLLETTEGTITLSASGLGGGNTVHKGRARSVKVGNITFTNPLIDFSTGKGADHDGVIGNGFLNRFKMITDYSRLRVILEPAEKMRVPTDFDLFMFDIVRNGPNFIISDVLPGATASAAGLKIGDVLLSVNGQSVAAMSLAEIKQMFICDGRVRVLSVQRGEEIVEAKFKAPRLF